MIKIFENGDVLMSGNEYKELMATYGGSTTNWQLACRYSKLMKFYYELKEAEYKSHPQLNISASSSMSYQVKYIREEDLNLFIEWKKLIMKFEPDRPIE